MSILQISFIALFLVVSLVPNKRALHMFQQNRYELYRYTKWLFRTANVTTSLLVFTASCVLSFVLKNMGFFSLDIVIAHVAMILLVKSERKKEYIKKLVYTARVKRQIVVMAFLMFVFLVITIKRNTTMALWGAAIFPYLFIYPMAILTAPIEKMVKKHFEKEARSLLASHPTLMKIGITGSFGKTSVKNIVYDLLSERFYTLKTPASYNTPMGITRTIRELLKPIHEVFLCEMGADHVGEITYLMDFVQPKYGIVTSVGPQHLNTFGSLENIIQEKMQMIEKLPQDGVGIVNMDNSYIVNYPLKNHCRIVGVGIHNLNADYRAEQIIYQKDGTRFTVVHKEFSQVYHIPLLGENNVVNALLAIALALELGVSLPDTVRFAEEIRPIEHRLEQKVINGYHFIDNAFNSNPVGCKQSLDVLMRMPGKRVIVTPGLIDLGKEEFAANKEFAAYMKDRTDFVILVGQLQREALLAGLRESHYPEDNIHCVNTVKEAFTYVYQHFTSEDTILLENDLPDAFLK